MPTRQILANQLADDRSAAETAADKHLDPDFTDFTVFAAFVPDDFQPDIVCANDGAILCGGIDGDLELARQIGKFRVERGPLAQDFACLLYTSRCV